VALLVQNLERLDESVKEEADGVHNTLGKWLLPSLPLPPVFCTEGGWVIPPLPSLPPSPLSCPHEGRGPSAAFVQAQL